MHRKAGQCRSPSSPRLARYSSSAERSEPSVRLFWCSRRRMRLRTPTSPTSHRAPTTRAHCGRGGAAAGAAGCASGTAAAMAPRHNWLRKGVYCHCCAQGDCSWPRRVPGER